ncbi:unnamed protein product [Rotaria socialis]|uniref:Ty3 transposon capsid-like protein domain-containing protein n=2 Tax=Rotaria socialis TaxID=392032 RepID=A0A817N5Y1_9BILA|nr:unnamed protein product [Rotaria socialis]CAF3299527.1 unnamed protein product [Rotaria socialis]
MTHKDKKSFISKNLTSELSHHILTTDNSFLSSTKYSQERLRVSDNSNRRKAIIPTPHKPKEISSNLQMNKHKDSINLESMNAEKDNKDKLYETSTISIDMEDNLTNKINELHVKEVVLDRHDKVANSQTIDNTNDIKGEYEANNSNGKRSTDENYKKINNKSNEIIKKYEEEKEIEEESQLNEDDNENNLDVFILQNFVRFSGKQNVIQWLDETENKFNSFHIGRNFRFEAISLLIEGEAKRRYIKYRKDIRTFDDFYEFLLSQFESTDSSSAVSKLQQTNVDKSNDLSISNQSKLINDSSHFMTNSNNNNMTNLTSSSHEINSTAMTNYGFVNSIGERSIVKSALVPDDASNSICDQTMKDLRKAIVGNLIKNPKTFKGGKDDVKKWTEEIEHLLDVAHIPDSTRLDLISYSLKGDALEWFKNNRSQFTSWTVFVTELKQAFTSSFQEELAFKQLESYTQGENQSIRSFFNEVMKLCKETDITMSEATKLKNLLNKTKPSIQIEVRKNKPKSTKEFLDYAKEAEELMQLSDMTINSTNTQDNIQMSQKPMSKLSSTASVRMDPPYNDNPNNYSANYSRNFDNNYQTSNYRSSYYDPKLATSSNTSAPKNKNRFNNNPSRFHQPNINKPSFNNSRKRSQYTQSNSWNNKRFHQPTVNAINPSYTSANIEPIQESVLANACNQCNQFGHEAPACPNF